MMRSIQWKTVCAICLHTSLDFILPSLHNQLGMAPRWTIDTPKQGKSVENAPFFGRNWQLDVFLKPLEKILEGDLLHIRASEWLFAAQIMQQMWTAVREIRVHWVIPQTWTAQT